MAEKQASDNENRRPASADAGEPAIRSGGLVGAILGGVAKIWNAVMADGVLEAAGRQGIDELGAALKPFPDSIQVSELGTLWSPTPGEIAADREHGRNPWPSEIANQNRLQPGKDHGNGHDNGHEAGYSM
jgi:hypothetical protein